MYGYFSKDEEREMRNEALAEKAENQYKSDLENFLIENFDDAMSIYLKETGKDLKDQSSSQLMQDDEFHSWLESYFEDCAADWEDDSGSIWSYR